MGSSPEIVRESENAPKDRKGTTRSDRLQGNDRSPERVLKDEDHWQARGQRRNRGHKNCLAMGRSDSPSTRTTVRTKQAEKGSRFHAADRSGSFEVVLHHIFLAGIRIEKGQE